MSEEQKKKISESHKGTKAWNKGLTKSDPRIRKGTEKSQKTIKERGSFALEKNPRWKGGKRAYKNIALKYYGKKCMTCGKVDEREKYIHVHHKDHNRNNNCIENLEVLCAKCHSAEHPRKASEYQKKRASETHKGKPKSLEQRKRMSEARKSWWNKENGIRKRFCG